MQKIPDSNSYSWELLETTCLVLPQELLVYYIYKYNLDKKAKRDSACLADASLIAHYKNILQKQKEVEQSWIQKM